MTSLHLPVPTVCIQGLEAKLHAARQRLARLETIGHELADLHYRATDLKDREVTSDMLDLNRKLRDLARWTVAAEEQHLREAQGA